MYNYLKYLGYVIASAYFGLYNLILYNSIYQLCLNNTLTNIQMVFMSFLIYLFGIKEAFTYLLLLTVYNKLYYITELINKLNDNYKLNDYFAKGHNYAQINYNEYLNPYVELLNEHLNEFFVKIYDKINNNEKYLLLTNKFGILKEKISPYMVQFNEPSKLPETPQLNLNFEDFIKNVNSQPNINNPNINFENMLAEIQNSEINKDPQFQDLLNKLNNVTNLANSLETLNGELGDNANDTDDQPLNRAQKRLMKKIQKKQDKKRVITN
ncbi:hypothetical protein Klosneuvirus_1_223 [Klosneuvirus KNV1]|uniref:Uncharacterized protein n=1 Tax=Klosneuvirus KNV1 TaxID=1977640 RepID=A0A1V0SI12_9VIRU|nr:hypothetical protein Klosneuvirus_1_223 [Klosneuvirus KNV1]